MNGEKYETSAGESINIIAYVQLKQQHGAAASAAAWRRRSVSAYGKRHQARIVSINGGVAAWRKVAKQNGHQT